MCSAFRQQWFARVALSASETAHETMGGLNSAGEENPLGPVLILVWFRAREPATLGRLWLTVGGALFYWSDIWA